MSGGDGFAVAGAGKVGERLVEVLVAAPGEADDDHVALQLGRSGERVGGLERGDDPLPSRPAGGRRRAPRRRSPPGTRRGPSRAAGHAPARRPGSRVRPRSSARRRSGRPRRRAERSARRGGCRSARAEARRPGRLDAVEADVPSSRKPANIPIAFEPPPTQAIAASGSLLSASRICARASRPITACSSRTISGYGSGPTHEPMR